MYLKETKDGVTLAVRVTPNASANSLTFGPGARLGVKLTAPPTEGRANKELIKFLAKKARVPRSSLTIVRGHSSREKLILISGGHVDTIRTNLEM
ncbi:MAG: DUF167 domain-containing protein [Desulfomonilaceae bacterium]|nr:DUF167 domain-containing protein [Desulfomonilaceae bacterium]